MRSLKKVKKVLSGKKVRRFVPLAAGVTAVGGAITALAFGTSAASRLKGLASGASDRVRRYWSPEPGAASEGGTTASSPDVASAELPSADHASSAN